mgnify:CR=1 FL=1
MNESGQFYKCFGCGKGGDVIKFIMEMESLSFSEAVKLLCEKAHIPLPEDVDGKSEGETRKKYAEKERLQALMRDAALFYVDMLKAPQISKAAYCPFSSTDDQNSCCMQAALLFEKHLLASFLA